MNGSPPSDELILIAEIKKTLREIENRAIGKDACHRISATQREENLKCTGDISTFVRT